MKLNYVISSSESNGPGKRFTVWTQGCSIHCPGCSNTDTWNPNNGYEKPLLDIVNDALHLSTLKFLDGITITGGEPLDQYKHTLNLCKLIKEFKPPHYSIFMTTGYTLKELQEKGFSEILDYLDILCVGPFIEKMKCKGQWKGSDNQELWYLTELGYKQSTMPVILKEHIIKVDGSAIETGFTT